MSRPLVISDCDEVLLHMVAPFRDWLLEQHGIVFAMSGHDFGQAMRRIDTGETIALDEVWHLLNLFFDSEMHRQSPIAGAVDAMRTLATRAASSSPGMASTCACSPIRARKGLKFAISSRNTSPAARSSSTIWPSITIRPGKSRPMWCGCIYAASRCWPRIYPARCRPAMPMRGSTIGQARCRGCWSGFTVKDGVPLPTPAPPASGRGE